MSQVTTVLESTQRPQLSRLSTAVRGKLQFMDYLVRAAVADVERFQGESDPGTRIFIRQLVEMHTASLRVESQNLRAVGDLCDLLDSLVDSPGQASGTGDSA